MDLKVTVYTILVISMQKDLKMENPEEFPNKITGLDGYLEKKIYDSLIQQINQIDFGPITKEVIENVIGQDLFIINLKNSIPKSQENDSLGLHYLANISAIAQENSSKYKKNARNWLYTLLIFGLGATIYLVIQTQKILEDTSYGMPKITEQLSRSIEEIRKRYPSGFSEEIEENQSYRKFESSINIFFDSIDELENEDYLEKDRSKDDVISKEKADSIKLEVDSLRSRSKLNIRELKELIYSRDYVNAEYKVDELIVALERINDIAPFKGVNEKIETFLQKDRLKELIEDLQTNNRINEAVDKAIKFFNERQKENSSNQVAELLKRIFTTIIALTLLFAILRYISRQYAISQSRAENSEKESYIIQKFYTVIKCYKNGEIRDSELLRSFILSSTKHSLIENRDDSKELEIIKEIFSALSKKL